MTTQEDYAVEANEIDAATIQAENENSEEATNTQEDYNNLLAEKTKIEEERENYKRMANKYKKNAKLEEISLDDDESETSEVKRETSKSFTAEEVHEIATKAAIAALENNRGENEKLVKVNSELKRSLSGKAPESGTSAEGSVDTTKTNQPYFSDSQKAFLKTLGVSEEEVMKTKEKNRTFMS